MSLNRPLWVLLPKIKFDKSKLYLLEDNPAGLSITSYLQDLISNFKSLEPKSVQFS